MTARDYPLCYCYRFACLVNQARTAKQLNRLWRLAECAPVSRAERDRLLAIVEKASRSYLFWRGIA